MGDELEKDVQSNPSRRRIIEVIGGAGKLSFSQIKKETNMSTGAIYYHLSRLQDFVEVDGRRRYHLNSNGEKLYRRIVSGYFVRREGGESTTLSRYMLTPAVRLLTKSRKTAVATMILSPLVQIAMAGYTQKGLIFFAPVEQTLMSSMFTPILLSIIPLWLLTKAFTLAFVKESYGEIELFAGIALSTLPPSLVLPLAFFDRILYQVCAILSITASILILTSVINLTKGISLQVALVFSMIVGYLSFMIELITV
ncbi:MAG: DUF7347 domain-containing protein [Nitrososphaeria archaeon]